MQDSIELSLWLRQLVKLDLLIQYNLVDRLHVALIHHVQLTVVGGRHHFGDQLLQQLGYREDYAFLWALFLLHITELI